MAYISAPLISFTCCHSGDFFSFQEKEEGYIFWKHFNLLGHTFSKMFTWQVESSNLFLLTTQDAGNLDNVEGMKRYLKKKRETCQACSEDVFKQLTVKDEGPNISCTEFIPLSLHSWVGAACWNQNRLPFSSQGETLELGLRKAAGSDE